MVRVVGPYPPRGRLHIVVVKCKARERAIVVLHIRAWRWVSLAYRASSAPTAADLFVSAIGSL